MLNINKKYLKKPRHLVKLNDLQLILEYSLTDQLSYYPADDILKAKLLEWQRHLQLDPPFKVNTNSLYG